MQVHWKIDRVGNEALRVRQRVKLRGLLEHRSHSDRHHGMQADFLEASASPGRFYHRPRGRVAVGEHYHAGIRAQVQVPQQVT